MGTLRGKRAEVEKDLQHMCIKECARKYDVTPGTLYQFTRRYGIDCTRMPSRNQSSFYLIRDALKKDLACMTVRECAEKHSIDVHTLYAFAAREGVPYVRSTAVRHGGSMCDPHAQDIVTALNSGSKIKDIAEMYKIHAATVLAWVRAHTVKKVVYSFVTQPRG